MTLEELRDQLCIVRRIYPLGREYPIYFLHILDGSTNGTRFWYAPETNLIREWKNGTFEEFIKCGLLFCDIHTYFYMHVSSFVPPSAILREV